MDKQKKIKFQNAARVVGGHIGLSALAIVAAAIDPVLGAVRTGKMLKDRKDRHSKLYKSDIKEALNYYVRHILVPGRVYKDGMTAIIKENKERVNKYEKKVEQDKYNMPEKLQETGVADLIKLIENAPVIERCEVADFYNTKHECIMIGDMWVIKLDNECVVGTEEVTWKLSGLSVPEVLLTFPVLQYVSVDNAAIKRIRKLKRQEKETEKSAFATEVAKRIGKDR